MRNYEREITNGESRGVEFRGEAAARRSSRTSLLSDGYTRLQLTRADINDSDMAKWPIRRAADPVDRDRDALRTRELRDDERRLSRCRASSWTSGSRAFVNLSWYVSRARERSQAPMAVARRVYGS